MNIKEIENAVYQLNVELYENNELQKLIDEYGTILDFSSDGFSSVIRFFGIEIWSTEDDQRKIDEETGEYLETLDEFLKTIVKRIILMLSMVKL